MYITGEIVGMQVLQESRRQCSGVGAEKELGASCSPRSEGLVLDRDSEGWLSSEAARLHMEGFPFLLATVMSRCMSSLTCRGGVNVWDGQGNVNCRGSMIAQRRIGVLADSLTLQMALGRRCSGWGELSAGLERLLST
jgi:hypothetical protein